MIYDLIIIGGGPAGVGAGVYAARKRLKTVVIAKEVSGQSSVSEDIQNWIGSISISGTELSKNLKAHLLAYANDVLELKEGELVEKIEKKEKTFKVKTNKNLYESKTVLIATGSRRRKLNIKGAEIFDNKGITYCASCDGPMFAGMDVAVIGGGNAGFGTASQLLAYVKSLTLFEHNEDFKAEAITVKNVLANPKMKGLTGVELLEIKGDKFVNAIVYREVKTGKTTELPIQGIFVEIGAVPATDFAKGLVEMDNFGKIIIDQKNQQTSEQGVWSAGDCTNTLYNQNNIAVGDAVRALEDIYVWLQKN
jgi:alkyl hydroperoxide reductase subunit AhpF